MPPLVLKLGGSLFEGRLLQEIVNRIASATRILVIVPGGGPFADRVREAQKDYGFSDALAHPMAVLAMQQMALVIIDMHPRLIAARSILEIEHAWRAARIPVWLPFDMVDADPGVSRTWTMTSDGLAAWLAGRLDGASVALVKSCAIPPGSQAWTLARQGVIDTEFARIVEAAGLDWHAVSASDWGRIDQLISDTDRADHRQI